MTRDRFGFTCSLVLIIYAAGKGIQNPVTECVSRIITSDVKLKRKKKSCAFQTRKVGLPQVPLFRTMGPLDRLNRLYFDVNFVGFKVGLVNKANLSLMMYELQYSESNSQISTQGQ